MDGQQVDSFCNLLEVVRLNSRILDLIADTLTELSLKRITLEEKMIQKHLLDTADQSARAVAGIMSAIKGQMIADDVQSRAAELKTLSEEMIPVLEEFRKMIRYNPNFLEQYYEYGFNERLMYEHRFAERMEKICNKLCTAIGAT